MRAVVYQIVPRRHPDPGHEDGWLIASRPLADSVHMVVAYAEIRLFQGFSVASHSFHAAVPAVMNRGMDDLIPLSALDEYAMVSDISNMAIVDGDSRTVLHQNRVSPGSFHL